MKAEHDTINIQVIELNNGAEENNIRRVSGVLTLVLLIIVGRDRGWIRLPPLSSWWGREFMDK